MYIETRSNEIYIPTNFCYLYIHILVIFIIYPVYPVRSSSPEIEILR